jgi:hypothetical protein
VSQVGWTKAWDAKPCTPSRGHRLYACSKKRPKQDAPSSSPLHDSLLNTSDDGVSNATYYGGPRDEYIDNLKATGQVEDGVIFGLDGTALTGGLALTAEEGAAIGQDGGLPQGGGLLR